MRYRAPGLAPAPRAAAAIYIYSPPPSDLDAPRSPRDALSLYLPSFLARARVRGYTARTHARTGSGAHDLGLDWRSISSGRSAAAAARSCTAAANRARRAHAYRCISISISISKRDPPLLLCTAASAEISSCPSPAPSCPFSLPSLCTPAQFAIPRVPARRARARVRAGPDLFLPGGGRNY
ncbi:hypothetical protein HETIRDRAFT_453180 [Heterobasidion irregulare TC 32-1]|uniref:Uncharacterized protein n=1 Tax=Heterobasidion irregulare (strain TC 32-1) TaxID=747525 RepID=W4JZK8_HETIT|nr:uncharacterized protein HETIRDRAFT_453180 [Heterobasidion irregulare TC 32-1]ETW78525.1 hypothetical protein HETIRDRAFT_453180 [Heterobasidion irregulare TC 32-1]